MMIGGSVEREYMTGLTYKEALQVCEDNGWIMDLGFI